MGSIGTSLMAAAEAGVMMVTSFVAGAGSWLGAIGAWAAANPVLAGALVGGLYSGAQTAIKGGSFSEVLKAAAIGAVTGAIGGAIGGPLGSVAGEVSGAVGGGTAGAVAGAVVHAAAHGVVGGLTSMAMGGTFQDGFIGSAIGAGVSSVMGAMPGMSALEGKGVLKVIGRTAVAAISGGAASVLAGGKFADGAYSAAFFHLFNSEVHRVTETQQGVELGNPLAHPEFGVDSSSYEYSYYSTRTEYNFITQETTVTHYYQHHGSTESFTPLDVLGMFRGIGAGLARGMRGLFAAKTATGVADDAFTHGLKYADRVRVRGVQDPVSHNFPYSFDDAVLSTKPIPKNNGYNIFQKPGNMNGKEGVFEIGVTKDGVIDHRFFRPN